MAIKVKEIAHLAGVSVATVSMVLNKKNGIGDATREKVLKIARENGYNFAKKSKKDRGNLQLTVYKKHAKVVNDTPFFHSLIEGIESEARQNSYKLNITYISNTTNIKDIADDINKHAIEGMLLIGTEMNEDDFRMFLEIDIPILLMDSNFINISSNYVVLDNMMGMHLAVKHLSAKGHKKIGYLKSPISIVNFEERFLGFKRTLEDVGAEYNPDYTVSLMPNMDSAYSDMIKYLSSNPELPTAYVADNDLIAMGAVKALRESNIKVPEQVSVIGFDDMPFCSMSEPTLTTIKVDKKEFGRLGVDKLVDIIQGNRICNYKTVLSVSMVERNSVCDLT